MKKYFKSSTISINKKKQRSENASGADTLLEQAISSLIKTTTSKTRLASFGLGRRLSGLPVKKESVSSEALDVVATA